MRFLLHLGMLAVSVLPVAAAETIWHFYPGDPAGGSLAVIEKGEIESPEPHWEFALGCYPGTDWTMTVAGIDPAKLGAAITAGEPPMFSLVVDGEVGGRGLGSYFPSITFGQMFGEWEYQYLIDKGTIDEMSAASSLGVSGTGVEVAYPGEGFKEGIAALRDACGKLEMMSR